MGCAGGAAFDTGRPLLLGVRLLAAARGMNWAMSDTDATDLTAENARDLATQVSHEQQTRWEIEDLVWLMKSKRGRRVMWRLLSNAGVYRLSYVQGDPGQTAFNEGSRNLGNRFLVLVQEHAAEDYALMVQERSNVRR